MKTRKKQKRKIQIYKSIKNPKILAFVLAAVFVLSAVYYSADIKRTAQRFINTAFAADFSTVISGAGTDPVTITVNSGSYEVNSDLAVPANVTLHFERGAVIYIANGATLSVNGTIDDCLYKIFDDANTDLAKGVKFANGKMLEVRPEWWGARADFNSSSSSANSNSIEKAVNSHSDYRATVIFSTGTYTLERAIVLKGTTSLRGASPGDLRNGTVFRSKWPLQFNAIEDSDQISHSEGGSITNVVVAYVSGGGIRFSRTTANWLIKDCNFYANSGWALYFDGGNNITIENNFFQNGAGQIYFHSISNAHVLYNEMASSGPTLDNCSNCELRGNIIFGDNTQGSGRASLTITNSNNVTVSASRLGPFDYGIKLENSRNITISDNSIGLISVHGIYAIDKVENLVIKENKISSSWIPRPRRRNIHRGNNEQRQYRR